jgi:hypothetical protein
MNYHYIDYMIKERRREELEACEKQRLLNSAGYSQKAMIRKGFTNLVDALRRLTTPWTLNHRRLYPYGSMVKVVARIRRETR